MLINGKDLGTWGCCLEDGDPFLIPHPIKPFPRNDNRLKHGVDMLRDAPRFDTKEFTLVFGFGSGNDLTQRINDFVMEIYKGGNVMYYKGVTAVVDYLSCTEFESINEVGKLAVRFESNSPFVKETATGYGTINLPNNVLSGVADVKLNGLTATNMLENSDFSQGANGWDLTFLEYASHDKGVLTVTTTSNTTETSLSQSLSSLAGNKYYACYWIRTEVDTMAFVWASRGIIDEIAVKGTVWTLVSGVLSEDEDGDRIMYGFDGDMLVGAKVEYTKPMCIDLTATFGAGNEPTKEQCDLMSNWFDGTKNVTTPLRITSVGSNLCELGVKGLRILGKNLFRNILSYDPNSDSYTFSPNLWGRSIFTNQAGAAGNRNVTLLPKLKNGVRYYFSHKKLSDGELTINLMNSDGTPYTSHANRRSIYVPIDGSDYYLDIRSLTKEQVVFKDVVISIDNEVEYSKYQESSLYVKDKEALHSYGATKDFIKDGLLHKNIKGGVVLDKPITTPIQTSGQVVAHPYGSIFIDPIVAVAGIYTDKAGIPDSSLPLLQLDELMVIDHETGREERLDVSKAVITESSFTHPDLKEGDTVFFEYYYDLNPIYGLNEVEYLNSNVVTKEMANKGLIK